MQARRRLKAENASEKSNKPNGMRRQDDKITGLGSQASRHPEQ
jgi:hypothetical protein